MDIWCRTGQSGRWRYTDTRVVRPRIQRHKLRQCQRQGPGVEAILMTCMPSGAKASAAKVADGIAGSAGLNMHTICGYAAVEGATLTAYTQCSCINVAVDITNLE
jgi:hypothetical protein